MKNDRVNQDEGSLDSLDDSLTGNDEGDTINTSRTLISEQKLRTSAEPFVFDVENEFLDPENNPSNEIDDKLYDEDSETIISRAASENSTLISELSRSKLDDSFDPNYSYDYSYKEEPSFLSEKDSMYVNKDDLDISQTHSLPD